MAALITLQTLVDALHNMVNSFQSQLTSTEVIVGENFERLVVAESIINSLKAQNSLQWSVWTIWRTSPTFLTCIS